MATPSTVTIGCKLPNGLVLSLGEARHELAGTRASAVIGGYGLTPVPAEFWAAWSRAYAEYPAAEKRPDLRADNAGESYGAGAGTGRPAHGHGTAQPRHARPRHYPGLKGRGRLHLYSQPVP